MPYKESGFYQELRQKLTWPWIHRVENATVDRGTPDVNFIAYKHRGWLELKREPVLQPGVSVDLRKEQVAWHLGFAQAGGEAWIALSAGGQYFLWRGEHARRLKKEPLAKTTDSALVWGSRREFYEFMTGF